MAQQEPWPLPHRIAIGGLRVDDGAFEQTRPGEQFGELGRARPIHRVDGVSMVGIAEGHGDEKEPSGCYELDAMAGQLIWVGDVFEQVAAEHGPRSKGASAAATTLSASATERPSRATIRKKRSAVCG